MSYHIHCHTHATINRNKVEAPTLYISMILLLLCWETKMKDLVEAEQMKDIGFINTSSMDNFCYCCTLHCIIDIYKHGKGAVIKHGQTQKQQLSFRCLIMLQTFVKHIKQSSIISYRLCSKTWLRYRQWFIYCQKDDMGRNRSMSFVRERPRSLGRSRTNQTCGLHWSSSSVVNNSSKKGTKKCFPIEPFHFEESVQHSC